MYSRTFIKGYQIQHNLYKYLGLSPIYWDNLKLKFSHFPYSPKHYNQLIAWKLHVCVAFLTFSCSFSLLINELFSFRRVLSTFNLVVQSVCVLCNFFRIVFELAIVNYGQVFLEYSDYIRHMY